MLAFQVLWRRGLGGAGPNVPQSSLQLPASSAQARGQPARRPSGEAGDRRRHWAGLSFQLTPCVSGPAVAVLARRAPGLGLSKGRPLANIRPAFFFNRAHRVLWVGLVILCSQQSRLLS